MQSQLTTALVPLSPSFASDSGFRFLWFFAHYPSFIHSLLSSTKTILLS